MAYERDILEEFAESRRRPRYRDAEVAIGMVVEHRASGFVGDVVKWTAEAVTLRDRHQQLRHFGWQPGAFLLDGDPVTLTRPASPAAGRRDRVTASGSVAAAGANARTAAASRLWVEGRHDAELLELVWGDELREHAIVVEPLHGADDFAAAVGAFDPGPARRLGVLLDHLVPGSKESRIAARIDDPNVLVTDLATFWPRLRNRVRSYADLRPELVGAVEQLLDFVAA